MLLNIQFRIFFYIYQTIQFKM